MKTKYVLLLIAGVCLSIVIIIGWKRGGEDGQTMNEAEILLRESLKEEFRQAYSSQVESSGEIKEFEFKAEEGVISLFDGIQTSVWSYNENVPGPEIRVNHGDTVRIKFKNYLQEGTTIHWHGVRVPNEMDGVPGITQELIEPGQEFVYEFTPKDPGTFWFHPHQRGAEQVERGLYGALIVEDKFSEQYDRDIVLMVDDWRLTDEYQIDDRFITPHDLMHDGRWGNLITVNSKVDHKINARPGEHILLRMINPSNARIYQLNFGRLPAKGVAVDGIRSRTAFNPNGFELAPGNRIDVEIRVPTDREGSTYTIADTFTRYTNTLSTIEVSGDPAEDSKITYPETHVPNWSDAVDVLPDATYILDAKRGGEYGIAWTMNGKAYPDYESIKLRYNEFNKIKFINDSSRLHPMHLHGQFFKVLSRNGAPINEPYFRDTVLIHPKEHIEIGVIPVDKGIWANHCHALEHAEAGMMTMVEVE